MKVFYEDNFKWNYDDEVYRFQIFVDSSADSNQIFKNEVLVQTSTIMNTMWK